MSGTLAIVAASSGDDRLGSMFVFFLIALVIVSPFGYRRIRAVLRERRPAPPEVAPEPATGEVTVADDLSLVVATISAAAATLAPGTSVEVEVPASPLVEGRPAPDAVVDALIGDAVRRSGLTAAWATDDAGRRLRLTRPSVP